MEDQARLVFLCDIPNPGAVVLEREDEQMEKDRRPQLRLLLPPAGVNDKDKGDGTREVGPGVAEEDIC